MPILKTKNENFFKKWTPKMAYVLGFFCADGSLTKGKRGNCFLEFTSKDKVLIEDLRAALESNHKISDSHGKNAYRLQIGSKKMFMDLNNLNIKNKKALRMHLPTIPIKYCKDFIRGYFDGDGNIWTGLTHKSRRAPSRAMFVVFTSGNKKFLDELNILIRNLLDIKGSISYHSRAYRLTFSTKKALSLCNFMYNNAALFLKRKRDTFEKYSYAAVV